MRSFVLALGMLAATPALAAPVCFVPYSEFEKTYPHVDLQSCPTDAYKPDEGFCRLALDRDEVRVYRFRHGEGDACLERIDSYAFADFVKRFGTAYEAN